MKKKILALLLALTVLFGLTTAFAEYEDVDSSAWYNEAVSYMVQSGYMNGVSETKFAPDAGMTRAMFVTVLGRMDGAYVGDYNKKIFPDVDMDLWYAQYVNWAFSNKIVSGFDDLYFHPDEQINRAQLSVMIKRYLDLHGYVLEDNPSAYDSYIDSDTIPEWAREGSELMRRTGIITGDAYGAFMPSAVATRAQIAAIVMRMRKVMNGEVLDIPQRQIHTKTEMIMSTMTLRDKVYQMMALTPEQFTGVNKATMAGAATEDAIQRHPVGTVLYGGVHIIDAAQIKEMTENTSSYSKIKPFIAISEETGSGAQLASKLGSDTYKDAYDYRNSDISEVKNAYSALSTQLKNCGFNLNLAPTSDLWSNPVNTYIGKRAFGNTYEECSKYTLAAINGIKEAGILSAMKYFPGYGSSSENPIDGECRSDRTLADLKNYDFNTYKDNIDAGVDFVICANILMPNIDAEYPASLSSVFINDLLRNELGFTGIVMTDDLSMRAVAQKYTSGDAAVRAVEAGCDILVCPPDFEEAVNAIINAVSSGRLSEGRIDESVERIINKKISAGIIG